jgi:putative tricarboxylic transport membrane protein
MNRASLSAAGFALLVAVGALFLLYVALQTPVRAVDILWGPRLFPVVVMIALAICGGTLAVSQLFFTKDSGEPTAEPNDWASMTYVLAGLVLFGVLVEQLGFVIAAGVLFVSVSRGFGSRRLLMDAAVGLVLAGAIYLLFVRVLGLFLPGGSLWSSMAG